MPTTHPTRPVCRTGLLALTGLLLWPLLSALPFTAGTVGAAWAQERPMTPTLLRRLAEAVDGHRTGNLVWIVAEWQFPNTVLAAFETRAAAVRDSALAAGAERPDLGLFGPFRAPVDTLRDFPGLERPIVGAPPIPIIRPVPPGCVHDGRTSVMQRLRRAATPLAFTTEGICPDRWVPVDSISAITMTYILTSGDTLTSPVPLSADALFFSVPALDKFVFPYYAGIVGMREAMRMRTRMLRDVMQ